MRNHNEKARDMARSVLPSTRRRGARADKAAARARERARLRAELHALTRLDDPDDFKGDLAWQARRDISEMVEDRRDGDKLAPLMRWAARTVENDPVLASAEPVDRIEHFRRLLPPGLLGRHALFHLEATLGLERYWYSRPRPSRGPAQPTMRDMVAAIVADGAHGELNRRIRRECSGWITERITLQPCRLIDADHPIPGVLLPRRTVSERRRVIVRYLAGAHDIDAFVADTGRWSVRADIIEALYREISQTRER